MRITHVHSSERRITVDVLQDSIIGPLMFSVLINVTFRIAGVRLSVLEDVTATIAAEQKANFAGIQLQSQVDAYVN